MTASSFRLPLPVVIAAVLRLSESEPELAKELLSCIRKAAEEEMTNFDKFSKALDEAVAAGFACETETVIAFQFLADKLFPGGKTAFADPIRPADHDALLVKWEGGEPEWKIMKAGIFDECDNIFPARPFSGNGRYSGYLDKFTEQPTVTLDLSQGKPVIRLRTAFDFSLTTLDDEHCGIRPCMVKGYRTDEKGKVKSFSVGSCEVVCTEDGITDFIPAESDLMSFASAFSNRTILLISRQSKVFGKAYGVVFEMPGLDMQPKPAWLAPAALQCPVYSQYEDCNPRVSAPVSIGGETACRCIDKLWWMAGGREFQAQRLAMKAFEKNR